MGLLLRHLLLKCLLFLNLPYFLTQCVSSVQRTCLYSERSALLRLKGSFILDRSASDYSKADSWKLDGWIGRDCCSWDGVECDDNTGHVIGLDLSSSFLYGSIDSNSTLFQLHHLRRLNLFDNDFNGSEIPSAIGKLSELSQLNLSYSAFSGQFPYEVLQLSKLVMLDLSSNAYLSAELPESIGNLKSLSHLDLSFSSISGQIPNSLANLTELTYLSLAFNDFTPSTLSWLAKLSKLTVLNVASTNSYGDVLSSLKNLTRLTEVQLSRNQFSSQIPSWLGNLTWLTTLELGVNQFWGPVPESIFTLIKLESLGLWDNLLTGTYKLESFLNLKNLKQLQLSGNKFSLVTTTVMNVTVPKLTILTLASCNLFEFPNFLSGQNELALLDLSGNKIHGVIPKWMWGLSAQTLEVLSLRENFLTGFHQPGIVPPWTNLRVLDLRSNKLRGSLPIPPASIYQYLVSNNLLKGEISSMICNLPSISILDISNNSFSGMLPPCLGNLSKSLSVLNLQSNNFRGPIPQTCEKRSQLRMIDLSQNQLNGEIPRSLVNCNMLELLNLGNNQIEDTFPSWLGRLQQLKVLVLRHNGFHGAIGKPKSNEFPKLRIFDLSFNKFEGVLPSRHFQRWTAMKVVDLGKLNYLQTSVRFQAQITSWDLKFQYSMTMTKAGVVTKYDKIQDILVAMDLSSNRFEGGIPEDVQILKAVQFLNLSNNLLSGSIPSSMANLTQLEALDLSQNLLSGEIPQELVQLTFLGFFNVSGNQLKGPIPQGKQFGTFENNSFEGNPGLCGKPLSEKCYPEGTSASLSQRDEGGDSWFEFGWKAIMLGFGSGVVNGLVLGYHFNPMKHKWFVKYFGRKLQNRRWGRRN
ncbi:receptor like protein 35 [Hibiscus trionum]|uniref:Receptor like protein 35 n=1 Tax=Hibiscus trionum TaxID=183268 RepID=A0A9W7IP58_HIBTR|nr:receptor like protein 35 [Hibiscus trionum]GMI98572.1 receptor like protein 35 [Hibiscus trionum]